MSDVRVRFAPSPTGHLHIGNARTAILNWLFARHEKGTFVLRIEDTDPERSKDEYIDQIYEDMKWLGLDWDEGPDSGGKYASYRQSERLDIYKKYADKLVKSGHAYHCYCTPEELEQMRKEAISDGHTASYNKRCFGISEEERQSLEAEGRKPALRFNVPEGEIKFHDIIKGEITFKIENISDFVIMRKEGIPTYNFAAVVDDSLMKISHVIRGDDHVSNTPRQVLLYNALDFKPPMFAHIPMILGSDRVRLSKRHGATSVDEFQQKGYLPQALINYLSLLSWSSASGDEILSIERLINEFDFNRISKSAAIFDVEKFNWMNGVYIRNENLDNITDLAIPFLKKAGYILGEYQETKKIISTVQEKLETIAEVVEQVKIFYQDSFKIEEPEARKIVRNETSQKVFWSFLRGLRAVDQLNIHIFQEIMKTVQKETGVMGKNLWMPVRIALTGQMHGPDLAATIELFGKQKCEELIENIIAGYRN